MQLRLEQRDRASLSFLGLVQGFAGGVLQPHAARTYAGAVPEPPLDLPSRRQSVNEALADSAAWHFDRFLSRWVAEEIYVRALPAVERQRTAVETWLDVPDAPGTLLLDSELDPPAYWVPGVHLAPGGWDGHDLMGAAIHDLVYPYVLAPGGVGAVRTGENLADQRVVFAEQAPRESYRRILDVGCGTGRFTDALQRVYPDAEIVGLELSAAQLRYAHAKAAHRGDSWELRQAAAEDTGLPDSSVDLVTMYTLFHETPPHATEAILREMLRVLEPGGDLISADPAPYSEQSAFRTAVLDWETENRGEPYWRSALQLDLVGLLKSVGYVDVEAFGIGATKYPWVTRARKPLAPTSS